MARSCRAAKMTYYPDLSPYVYMPPTERDPTVDATSAALNVGWLDDAHPFSKGDPTPDLVERLLRLCVRHPRNMTRGHHRCQLCPRPAVLVPQLRREPATVMFEGERHFLGSAEIHVRGRGATYHAPDLVIHYVMNHRYAPPDVFTAAVLASR